MSTADNLSVVKAFHLLQIVCRHKRSIALGQLAAEAQLSVATTHRLLRTLKRVGAVRHALEGGYELGSVLSELGASWYNIRRQAYRCVETELDDLSARLTLPASLSILNDDMMAHFIGLSASSGHLDTAVKKGASYEAYCLAPGQVLLANLSRDKLLSYIHSSPLISLTPRTITDADRLLARLEHIRERSVATEDREFDDCTVSIAVPVRDTALRVVAALAVSSNDPAVMKTSLRELIRELRKSSAQLLAKLHNFPHGARSLALLEDFSLVSADRSL